MKKYILLFICIFIFGSLCATTIKKITDISNPDIRFSYDRYHKTVLDYEDRLIVMNLYKIEEFLRLPDGGLEKIGFFEVREELGRIYIDEDKLYSIDRYVDDTDLGHIKGLYIYDLSQTPMEFVDYVDINIPGYSDNLFFSEKHIMFSDWHNERTVKICKNTYEIDGYIYGLSGGLITRHENIIFWPFYNETGGIQVKVYEIDEYDSLTMISAIDIDVFGRLVQDAIYENTKMILTFIQGAGGGIAIIDYHDLLNPSIWGTIHSSNQGFSSAQLSGDLLFTYSNGWYLRVYERNASGSFSQIFFDDTGSNADRGNLRYVEPYLYVNNNFNLKIYDVANGFNVVNTYGDYVMLHPNLSFSEDEIYYMATDIHSQTQRIYSVFDNALICTLNLTTISMSNMWGETFNVIDDKLYLFRPTTWSNYLDIYHIEAQQAVLSKSINLGSGSTMHNIVGNKVFISNAGPTRVSVYDLVDDELHFIGSFEGHKQYIKSSEPTEYILNLHENVIFVRDINDPNNILLVGYIDVPIQSFVIHLDDGYFVAANYEPYYSSQVFSFDIEEGTLTQIAAFEDSIVSAYNGILTVKDKHPGGGSFNTFGNYSRYYTIIEGELVEIGAERFDRNVMFTYFFPERKNMVQIAQSGIWVYDFEYELVSEGDVVISRTGLLSNYPNPFNPETTISFTVGDHNSPHIYGGGKGGDTHIRIDIYNIRGQKIKSLVDEFKAPGNHQVVWNGTDDYGRDVASGIYFYHFRTEEHSATRRMVLMK